MNQFQKIMNARMKRKFTTGDSVEVNGKDGEIISSIINDNSISYYVKFPNEPLQEFNQDILVSKPKLDTHKYGSQRSGYTGGNNY